MGFFVTRPVFATVIALIIALVGLLAVGQLSVEQYPNVAPPQVKVNGAPARLAPGARIRAQDNKIALSAPLIGVELLVNYTLDNQGQVKNV